MARIGSEGEFNDGRGDLVPIRRDRLRIQVGAFAEKGILMNEIERAFAETFAPWDIHLPQDEASLRKPGKIFKGGWMISYVFGEDYLDYFAEHRMTNPRHVRIQSDGRMENFEAPRHWYVAPRDGDEKTREEAQEEFYAYNEGYTRC